MSSGDVKIEIVTEKDRPWIVEFLSRNFYKYEPITDYLKICENPSSLEAVKKFSTKNLYQNLSFVVRDLAGNLLGVCINSVHSKDDDPDEIVTDPLFGKIARCLGYGYEEAHVFDKFPDVDKVVYIDILSVDTSAGGRGIGALLVDHVKLSVIATSNISERNFSIALNKRFGITSVGVNNRNILQQQISSIAVDKQKFHYRIINANDTSKLLEFFKANFYADEPVNHYLNIMGNAESMEAISKYYVKDIAQNISLLAKSESGEFAGVCLNSIKSRKDREGEPITEPIFAKIFRLLQFAYNESKVFEKFPDIDEVMSFDVISVDRKFQGHSIATILFSKSRDLAREKGIKMIRVDCTSHFSARVCEKLGMQRVYELKYSDYKENGVQVFDPPPPHTGLKVYVQRLDT